ncbi:MAG: glycosyltransferase family 2 protein [Candidatus Margulisiibacteriota bacterium]
MALPTLGILILTKNEAAHIGDCLASCKSLGETLTQVMVLDSQSTDTTLAIAEANGAQTAIHPFTNFRDQRQHGASLMTTDWILFLDADERLTPELGEALKTFIAQSQHSLLEIPRLNHVLGKPIYHCGWYPDYQARLVRRDTLRFADTIVHEKVESTGSKTQLPLTPNAHIVHYTFETMTSYFAKVNHYTTLEAEYFAGKNAFTLTRWGLFSRAFGMFTQTLFHFKGRKDGMHGFIIAMMNFVYSYLLMAKVWEKENRPKTSPPHN